MANELPRQGLLRVVSPAALDQSEAANDKARVASETKVKPETADNLARYIRTQFDMFKRHRDQYGPGWSQRLIEAQRAFKGEYAPDKLASIKMLGGSEVYARLIAMKCRGTSSLLRDVYLGPDKPWAIMPPADPDVDPDIVKTIGKLVAVEVGSVQQEQGTPMDLGAIRDRTAQLMDAARQAEKKNAAKRAKIAEDKIEEILQTGDFYQAFSDFLIDVPLFPFAVIKGPTVKIVPSVEYVNGMATATQKPRMFWSRISPFDIWWTPGATDIEQAQIIERFRLSRADLNDLLDLPGYDHAAIREVLSAYGTSGVTEDWDSVDTERAEQENRENPQTNESGMISCLEFHGNVQGTTLIEAGMSKKDIPDELRDYMVQAWLIGRYVIKVQLSPSPRKRHPYFVTSFEKVPGTPVGNGLPDILSDIQESANAALRSLINNLSISSGPQVVINDDRLAPGEDGETLYPWKRWHTTSDPMANNTQPAISFFQPTSNAQELMAIYTGFSAIADELSAIPKYMSGQNSGGAGRTAAGLAMLMGNASKILQTVAANIDRDVVAKLLTNLFDMIMLTDTTGELRGDENIRVMGVNVAVQRETQRARQLEFLQITANPIDIQIMKPTGRAAVLRSVAATIGLDGQLIVPSESDMEAEMKAQQGGPAPGAPPQAPPGQPPGGMPEAAAQAQGGQQGGGVTNDMGPRVNITGGAG